MGHKKAENNRSYLEAEKDLKVDLWHFIVKSYIDYEELFKKLRFDDP